MGTIRQGKNLRGVDVKKENTGHLVDKALPSSFRSELHFSIDLEHRAILGQ